MVAILTPEDELRALENERRALEARSHLINGELMRVQNRMRELRGQMDRREGQRRENPGRRIDDRRAPELLGVVANARALPHGETVTIGWADSLPLPEPVKLVFGEDIATKAPADDYHGTEVA